MPKQIAVVDDEVEMEYIYSMLFEDAISAGQLELIFFSDSKKFLEWFEKENPHLVITDVNMPLFSGIELGQRINASKKNVMTYFVSGDDRSYHQEALKDLTNCRYFTKPMDVDEMRSFVLSDLNLLA